MKRNKTLHSGFSDRTAGRLPNLSRLLEAGYRKLVAVAGCRNIGKIG